VRGCGDYKEQRQRREGNTLHHRTPFVATSRLVADSRGSSSLHEVWNDLYHCYDDPAKRRYQRSDDGNLARRW
jgi:hypothetical protein